MALLTVVQAVNNALRTEMRRNPHVVVLGEDVGKVGGVFRATDGLYQEFGPERVIDTPLAENGIIGTAIGMALYGLRPVAEIQFMDFIFPAYDQIVSELAKFRWRSGGHYSSPIVIRTPCGGGIKGGLYHSQSTEVHFCHTPGLKVVVPSTPSDTKGLLLSAMRDDDPVLFMEPKRIYRSTKEEVPEGDYTVPIGPARLVREGRDVSIFAYGAMIHTALESVEQATKEGIECELIDVRTLLPFDRDAVLNSVAKTGRAVIVHEAPKTCGFGAEIAATIAEEAIDCLKAPIVRVTGFDTPFPYTLENVYLPDAQRILDAVKRVALY
jgi:2-oxoisovalerate dehydrogenase E1 component beta subunit